jgi:hypothetical protein
MALEAEKKKAREDENHYLYVVGYLFKTIDQERVRSSFLRQQTKDVNTIEMIKKMGIIDEESDYFSPDFKGTWETVLKTSECTKSFQVAYDKYRESLTDNLKEEYGETIRVSEAQLDFIVNGRHKASKPSSEESILRQQHEISKTTFEAATIAQQAMIEPPEVTLATLSDKCLPISEGIQGVISSTRMPLPNERLPTDDYDVVPEHEARMDKIALNLSEETQQHQTFTDDITYVMQLLLRISRRAIRSPTRNKGDAEEKVPSYVGISNDKAEAMGEWNILWNGYLKAIYKSESSKIGMKIAVALRSVQLTTLGMYDKELLKNCSPATRKYLQGLSNPIQQPKKRVTVATMINQWKKQAPDVAYINTDPAVMERFPGSLSIRFSLYQEPALCAMVPNLPNDQSTLSISSSGSTDNKRKQNSDDATIKKKRKDTPKDPPKDPPKGPPKNPSTPHAPV